MRNFNILRSALFEGYIQIKKTSIENLFLSAIKNRQGRTLSKYGKLSKGYIRPKENIQRKDTFL